MGELAAWVASTAPSRWMQDYPGLILYLQTIHILGVAMVLSAALMISLRLLRFTHLQTLTQTMHRFMPWLWSGMVILLGTGILQILAEPKRTLNYNLAFMLKMALLILAVGLTAGFQRSMQTNAARWGDEARPRTAIQLFAVLMLLLWFAISVAGRWIAYARIEVM